MSTAENISQGRGNLLNQPKCLALILPTSETLSDLHSLVDIQGMSVWTCRDHGRDVAAVAQGRFCPTGGAANGTFCRYEILYSALYAPLKVP